MCISEILDRLALAEMVLEEVRETFETPDDPEKRADLLLAVEDVAIAIAKLHRSVDEAVWEYQPN